MSIVPVVEFAISSHSSSRDHVIQVKEPLSNNQLDSLNVTLTLRRSGDTSRPSTIRYFTSQSTALNWQDYVPISGSIIFENEATTAEISVQILSNARRDEDSEFLLALSQSHGTSVGNHSTVRILIKNNEIQGPYFPALPVLDNAGERGSRAYTGGMTFDLPLICITVR